MQHFTALHLIYYQPSLVLVKLHRIFMDKMLCGCASDAKRHNLMLAKSAQERLLGAPGNVCVYIAMEPMDPGPSCLWGHHDRGEELDKDTEQEENKKE